MPFARDEYVSAQITAYFNLDLSQIRAYGFSIAATEFLIALSLYKIRRVLEVGLRFRTACDLDLVGELTSTRPKGFTIPGIMELETALGNGISTLCDEGTFDDGAVSRVTWK